MATRYRVTCTQKHEKHEHVLALGCFSPSNTFHKFTEAEVIERIEHHSDTFYTERPDGHVAEVIIVEIDGKKYLKTKADGERPNNLDWLKDCPEKHKVVVPPVTAIPTASHGTDSFWGS